MTRHIHFTIKPEYSGVRLDIFLCNKISNLSRSHIQKLIKSELVLLNSVKSKPSIILKENDKIEIIDSNILNNKNEDLSPNDINIDILFENDDLIVINKPAGICVHSTDNLADKSMVNALINYYPPIVDAVLEVDSMPKLFRPGIAHRLDKDTSGVMVIAKNRESLIYLSNLFKTRSVEKKYLAICSGWPKDATGELINYLGRSNSNRKIFKEVGVNIGKMAHSKYKTLSYYKTISGEPVSFVEFNILTGRTHQIRSQSLLNGFPVVGDKYYFNHKSKKVSQILAVNHQLLHSKILKFVLPNNTEPTTFIAPLPVLIQQTISKLIEQR